MPLERGRVALRFACDSEETSLTAARVALLANVLTRHAQASGLRVSEPAAGEPRDVCIGDASSVLEQESQGASVSCWLEVAQVGLAPTAGEPVAVPTADALSSRRERVALRYLLLSTHYREPLLLSAAAPGELAGLSELEEAEQRASYLYATKRRLLAVPAERIVDVESKPPPAIGGFPLALQAALDADLDTPRALAECERFLAAVNELSDHAGRKRGKLVRSHLEDAIFGLTSISGRLGIGDDDPKAWLERVRDRRALERGLSKTLIETKIRERIAARDRKDFAAADALRDELTAWGVELVDSGNQTSWTVAP